LTTLTSDYRNYDHYIKEGWLNGPKESAKRLADLMLKHQARSAGQALDVGCATGELMAYLNARFPDLSFTGADVFDELLETGRRLLPSAQFVNASILQPPASFFERFDVVTAIGVMSIFDEEQLTLFWKNLLDSTKVGGWIAVLSPLNEYGIDAIIRHRKRRDGQVLPWESGWNVFSIETIREVLEKLGQHDVNFERFVFEPVLLPKPDRIRTWTLPTRDHPHQLTNGLKLLVDHYFITLQKQ
jgi:trans-aconitate methyltransferase